jgi:hypothetical protein
MKTIVEFLEARIAEDEAVAQAAIGSAAFSRQTGHWIAEDVHGPHGTTPLVFAVTDSGKRTQVANFEAAWERDERRAHVARHDPARVLAECAAKRALIDAAFDTAETVDGEWGCVHGAGEIRAGKCAREVPDELPELRILAAVYADHEDYQPEWVPHH